MDRMLAAARDQSLLAKKKISLDQIAREYLPRFEKLRREGQSGDWELCASSVEASMSQVHDHLDFLMALEALRGEMQTLADVQVVSGEVSLNADSTANAVQMLGFWINGPRAACFYPEAFTVLRSWVSEMGPVLAGVKQSAGGAAVP